MNETATASTPAAPTPAGTALWIALIAGLTVLGSFAYACAAPMAAIAALAAFTMGRRDGLALILVAWIVNQAVGFLLLSYPHDPATYAWGVAIGLATVLGFFAARAVARVDWPLPVGLAVTFAAAFVFYQIGMAVAGVALAYEGDVVSTEMIREVGAINAVAYVGFLLIHRAAVALALVRPARLSAPATA